MNNDFERDWKSLNEAVMDLETEMVYCFFDIDTFVWEDNGKVRSYIIGNIDINKENEFQDFNVLID